MTVRCMSSLHWIKYNIETNHALRASKYNALAYLLFRLFLFLFFFCSLFSFNILYSWTHRSTEFSRGSSTNRIYTVCICNLYYLLNAIRKSGYFCWLIVCTLYTKRKSLYMIFIYYIIYIHRYNLIDFFFSNYTFITINELNLQ